MHTSLLWTVLLVAGTYGRALLPVDIQNAQSLDAREAAPAASRATACTAITTHASETTASARPATFDAPQKCPKKYIPTVTATAVTDPHATVSCEYVEEDSTRSASCLCYGSVSMPMRTLPHAEYYTSSCLLTGLTQPIVTPTPTSYTKGEVVGDDCTTTSSNGAVLAFPGSTIIVDGIGPYPLTVCTGKSVVLHPPTTTPKPTGQVVIGTGAANVGTLTGSKLSSSIHSAISTLCATTTTGSPVYATEGMSAAAPKGTGSGTTHPMCGGSEVSIKDVFYADEHGFGNGDLKVTILSSMLNKEYPHLLDVMLWALASAANGTATGKNCDSATVENSGGGIDSTNDVTVCSMTDFMAVNYMLDNELVGFLYVKMEFVETESEFFCDVIMPAVQAGLDIQGDNEWLKVLQDEGMMQFAEDMGAACQGG